jgi:hypothetical protein
MLKEVALSEPMETRRRDNCSEALQEEMIERLPKIMALSEPPQEIMVFKWPISRSRTNKG